MRGGAEVWPPSSKGEHKEPLLGRLGRSTQHTACMPPALLYHPTWASLFCCGASTIMRSCTAAWRRSKQSAGGSARRGEVSAPPPISAPTQPQCTPATPCMISWQPSQAGLHLRVLQQLLGGVCSGRQLPRQHGRHHCLVHHKGCHCRAELQRQRARPRHADLGRRGAGAEEGIG